VIINNLLSCLEQTSDKHSKKLLSTVLRRELENEMRKRGYINLRPEPTVYELSLANNNKKLEAVKMYKERTGLGLLESKRAIEGRMS
jgi:ribosomal protein L7/L12